MHRQHTCYNRYMSDAEHDAIYGRLHREIGELGRDVALCEAELSRMGRSFEVFGKQLQTFAVNVDRPTVEADMSVLWTVIEKYQCASRELSDKKTQLDKIDGMAHPYERP